MLKACNYLLFVYIESGYVLLRTFGRETEMLAQPLTKIAEELDPDIFFRINPQCIVHRLCRNFRHIPNSKLEISLGAPMNRREEVTRGKVQDFLEWLKK